MSIRQILVWREPITFYTYTLRHAETARLRNNLGMAHAEAGHFEEAISHYERSIQLYDGYPQTYHNLANTYKALGKYDLAREAYKKALVVDPYFFFSLNYLIALEIEEKNTAEAIKWLKYGLEKFPNNATYQSLLRDLEQ